jgi:hypothetical protein
MSGGESGEGCAEVDAGGLEYQGIVALLSAMAMLSTGGLAKTTGFRRALINAVEEITGKSVDDLVSDGRRVLHSASAYRVQVACELTVERWLSDSKEYGV